MLRLGEKWAKVLTRERESGMGYQVVSIFLMDGRRYDGVVVVDGMISKVADSTSLPFVEEDIARIVVTHDPIDRSGSRAR
jgi:hypothetical protein